MKPTGSSPTGDSRRRAAALLLAPLLLGALAGRAAASDGWLERVISSDVTVSLVATAEAARPDPEARRRHVGELAALLRKAGPGPEEDRRLNPVYDALGVMGTDSRPAVPLIVKRLKSPASQAEWDVATRPLMETLARIGATPETLPAFLSQLDSPDPVVALRAAEALGLLGAPSPEAARALLTRLPKLPDAYTKMAYARSVVALGPLGEKELALVSGFLKHPEPTTRYAATWMALETFPGKAVDRRGVYDAIPKVVETARCNLDGRTFRIEIRSFSGEASEDDATVWVVDGAEPGLAGFGGRLESFTFLPVRPGHGSPCDVEAFTSRDGVLFVPLLADARPLGKQMAGLAWDPRSRRVVASSTGLGAVPETAVVEPLASGFAFREEPQPSDSANCPGPPDAPCGAFRGKPVRSYTEGVLPVVWEVSRVPGNGGLAKRLDLARTFEEAPVRKLFESRDAFARAFGLDPGHSFVETPFYGRLVLADGESWLCAAPARERTGDATRCRREGAGKP